MAIKVVLDRSARGNASGQVTYEEAGHYHVDASGNLHVYRDAGMREAFGSHASGKWDSVYQVDKAADTAEELPAPLVA